MESSHFDVIFLKLEQVADEDKMEDSSTRGVEATRGETEEIGELVRLACEMSEPNLRFFAGT